MLQSLSIRNVVLIDKLDLDFSQGLSVLTGETGTGKSILLDSLGLVLGNRAETSLIRYGEDKLSVSAVFDYNPSLKNIFEENDLEVEDEIVIKRSLTTEGKGKIFVNEQVVSVKLLKEIGKYLVEVHGQFDNHGLLNPVNHLSVLDSYAGHKDLVLEVSDKYKNFKNKQKQRKQAEDNIAKAKDDEENLRHWLSELEKLSPEVGEEESLAQKRLELMNSEKIIESLNFSYNILTQNIDVESAIRQAQTAMDKANSLVDGKYDAIIDTLDRALIEARDAISEIENASSNVSANSNELETIEGRLFALKAMSRKHQCQIDGLNDVMLDYQTKLSAIELGEGGLEALRKSELEAKLSYIKFAKSLSAKRKDMAKALDANVMNELAPLKMEKARFITQVEELAESSWTDKGLDNVWFSVSTNPNSPQGPINKIASGGELARFMLALKVNLAKNAECSAMIFDEVDAGVGGATAQAVGERLSRLAQDVQVMCVTHSPQVASKGATHYKVEKDTKDNITTTSVRQLDQIERREEVARMLAGEVVTEQARAAAEVLIAM